MSSDSFVVDEVIGVADVHGTLEVQLRSSGRFRLSGVPGADWAEIARHRRGQALYFEYNRQTRDVVKLLVPLKRKVHAVGTESDGRVPVNLYMSPSVNYLRASHARFREMYDRATTAAREGTTLLVTRDTTTGEILDMREGVE